MSILQNSLKYQEYPIDDYYVSNKIDQSLILKPKLQIDQKASRKDLWPRDAQVWVGLDSLPMLQQYFSLCVEIKTMGFFFNLCWILFFKYFFTPKTNLFKCKAVLKAKSLFVVNSNKYEKLAK